MAKHAIDLSRLSPDERFELLGEVWDSLESVPFSLSEEQRAELRRRVARVQTEGVSGTTIQEIRARLVGG